MKVALDAAAKVARDEAMRLQLDARNARR